MATPKAADSGTPEKATDTAKRTYDPLKKVRAYDTATGVKLSRPVPETWLDGRFPNLKETSSSKAGN